MILVEGMDNTGKTTLVESLCQKYPELTYRPSIGNKHDVNKIREAAYEEAFEPFPMVISDRSRVLSEYVYQPILQRRETAYSFNQYVDMVRALAKGHHLFIFAWRPIHEVLKTFHESEQLEGVSQNAKQLYRAYQELEGMMRFLLRASESRSQIHDYDYEDGVSRTLAFTKVSRYIKEVSA